MKRDLNDLEIYREAMDLGEEIWEAAVGWNYFARDTVGKQIVRSVDSIAANLAEGHGRFHYLENRRFCHFARGSSEETRTWIEKSARRGLMDREQARIRYARLETLERRLNSYIASIGRDSRGPASDFTDDR